MATNQDRLEAMQSAALGLGLNDLVGPAIQPGSKAPPKQAEPEPPMPVITVKRSAKQPQSKAAKAYYGNTRTDRRERASAIVGLIFSGSLWLIGLYCSIRAVFDLGLKSAPLWVQAIGVIGIAVAYCFISQSESTLWRKIFSRDAWAKDGPLLGLILFCAILDYIFCFGGSKSWVTDRAGYLQINAPAVLSDWLVPALATFCIAFMAEPVMIIAWDKYKENRG